MLYKIVAVLLAVILALNCCCIRSSATISYTSMPDIHDYPQDESGYNAYVKDMITYGAVNVTATLANPFLFVTEEIGEYFGIDMGSMDMTPQDLVGDAFSKYYQDPNYIFQYNSITAQNGDLKLRCIINTDNPPIIDDSHLYGGDGFYNGMYGYFQFELLYKGEIVDKFYHAYTYKPKVYWDSWEWKYNSNGYISGFRYYFRFGTSAATPQVGGFTFSIDDYVDGDIKDITVEVPQDQLYKDAPIVFITDTDHNNKLQEFYYVYEGEKPTFVNTNNYNDKYYYNDNGQITYNNNNYYTYPVVDTHTADQLAQLKNMVALMLTLAAAALSDPGASATDLSQIYIYLQQLLSLLTSQTGYLINQNTLIATQNSILGQHTTFLNSQNNMLSNLVSYTDYIRQNMLSRTELDASLGTLHQILEVEDTQEQLLHMEQLLALIAADTTAILAVLSLEDLEELTEEEKSYLDVLAALIDTISTFIPFTAVQAQMTDIHNIVFTGQPASDITVNILGQNMTLLSVDFVGRISSTLSIVKNLLSVFILYAWLKIMRKKMVDI